MSIIAGGALAEQKFTAGVFGLFAGLASSPHGDGSDVQGRVPLHLDSLAVGGSTPHTSTDGGSARRPVARTLAPNRLGRREGADMLCFCAIRSRTARLRAPGDRSSPFQLSAEAWRDSLEADLERWMANGRLVQDTLRK